MLRCLIVLDLPLRPTPIPLHDQLHHLLVLLVLLPMRMLPLALIGPMPWVASPSPSAPPVPWTATMTMITVITTMTTREGQDQCKVQHKVPGSHRRSTRKLPRSRYSLSCMTTIIYVMYLIIFIHLHFLIVLCLFDYCRLRESEKRPKRLPRSSV